MIDNENDFATIRGYLLSKSTISEYQMTSQIAKTIVNDFDDTMDNPLLKIKLNQKSKWVNDLITDYTLQK